MPRVSKQKILKPSALGHSLTMGLKSQESGAGPLLKNQSPTRITLLCGCGFLPLGAAREVKVLDKLWFHQKVRALSTVYGLFSWAPPDLRARSVPV